jgi:hypothetical protein
MTEQEHTAMKPLLTHVDTWESLAVDYLDDALSPSDRALVDAHLEACASCREAVAEQRTMMGITRNMPQAAVPPELTTSVLEALGIYATGTAHDLRRDRRGAPSLWQRLIRASWAPVAVALLAVAIGVAAWAGTQSQSGRPGPEADGVMTATTAYAPSLASGSTASPTAASTLAETSADQAGPATTAAASTTAAATTSSGLTSGGTGGKATVTTAAAATTATAASATVTLAATSTTGGTTALVPTLGLTPVFLTVAAAGAQSAEASLTSLPSAAVLQLMPPGLWLGSATFAAVMSDADRNALMAELLDAGLSPVVQMDLPYNVGYLDQVAHELGLTSASPRSDNLVIVTLSGD